MNRLVLILGLIGALAAPAAANWQQGCQSGTGFQRNVIGGGGTFTCHNPTAADDDPSVLDVSGCENVDIFWYDNVTGDGSGDVDGTASVYTCPVTAVSAVDTEAERLAACQPFNGGTTLDATNTELEGLGAVRIWVDVELASTENQLVVRCSQPAGN